MKYVGRASASQVIACYRNDFRVRALADPWPELTGDPRDVATVPVARLKLIEKSERPIWFALEHAWDLYEAAKAEVLAFRAMWGDYAYPVEEIAESIRLGDGRWVPPADAHVALGRLRGAARLGELKMEHLVATQHGADPIRLVDGHHRVIAAILESRLPETVLVILGTLPVSLGIAALNGAAK